MAEEEFSNRELETVNRNLKSLSNTLRDLKNSGLESKDAVTQVIEVMEKSVGEERKSSLERLAAQGQIEEKMKSFKQTMLLSGYEIKDVDRLMKDFNNDARLGAKSFRELSDRMKDCKLDVKEMGNLTADFFKLAKTGWAAAALAVGKFAFDADVMAKKAALVAGGPAVGAGGFFTPDPEIRSASTNFIIDMAWMGKSVQESIAVLKKWNFTVREQGSEIGSASNAKYIMEAGKVTTAMAALAQVSENTANKLAETLMGRLGYSGGQVDTIFQKLVQTNKSGALTNEQYISSVTEMIEKNMRYNNNMGNAIPIVKEFETSIRNGTFSVAEIASTFTAMASMPSHQSAGLAMLMQQYGQKLPETDAFKRAGNDPFALAEASFFAGSSPELTMKAIRTFGGIAGEAGYGEGRAGRFQFMSNTAKSMGFDLNPKQIQDLIKAEKSGRLDKDFQEITKPSSDTQDMAKSIVKQTSTVEELLTIFKGVVINGTGVKMINAAQVALLKEEVSTGIIQRGQYVHAIKDAFPIDGTPGELEARDRAMKMSYEQLKGSKMQKLENERGDIIINTWYDGKVIDQRIIDYEDTKKGKEVFSKKK